jgi:regulatory protein
MNGMRKNFRRSGRAKIPTIQSLELAALSYLSRYAASEFSLRRALENRIRRASFHHTAFASDTKGQKELRAAIETIIARHRKTGALNDSAYAAMKAVGARRAGKSARVIRLKLAQKGVSKGVIEHALTESDDGEGREAAELKAARNLARRRKWGSFRSSPRDLTQKRKEFAAMARAGFSLAVIRKVLGEDPED